MIAPVVTLPVYETEIGMAQPLGHSDNTFEDGSDVARRLRDNCEYFRRSRLEFERFSQLALARLLGFEQPRVLDCDDSLIGEGLQQCDLFLRERPHFHAADHEGSNGLAFAKERDSKASSMTLA